MNTQNLMDDRERITCSDADPAVEPCIEPGVLVIDDEPDTVAAAELTLRSYGHDVVWSAPDGEAALDLMAAHPVGAVLMDFTMPGLAGYDLLAALVEMHPQVPVVVVTALDDVTTAIQCMQIGASSYLIKPVKPEEYIREARKALEIHELRQQNARFERQAQRMEGLNRLCTEITSEFNNLLQVVTSSCELVARAAGNTPEATRHMLRATHAARFAAESATRLQGFARGGPPGRRTVDLNGQLKRFTEFFKPLANEKVRVELETEDTPCFAKLCPDDLHQALLNLAVNAVDAMPRGGRLTIRCTRGAASTDESRLTLLRGPRAETVRLEVEDSGCGMDEEMLADLQERLGTPSSVPGKRTRQGLETVAEIQRINGGGLDLWTRPGQGTVVSLTYREIP